jgi:hypothetical protein
VAAFAKAIDKQNTASSIVKLLLLLLLLVPLPLGARTYTQADRQTPPNKPGNRHPSAAKLGKLCHMPCIHEAAAVRVIALLLLLQPVTPGCTS